MKPISAFLALAASIAVSLPAWSGPNEGGVLVVHANEGLVYSPGTSNCGLSELEECGPADIRVDDTDVVVFFVLAAFPEGSNPRMAGVVFGVDYDAAQLSLLDWNHCGDFELHEQFWPDPGNGTAITWAEAQTDRLTEIYWFAGYDNYGNPWTFDTIGHPQGGGQVADDAIPANVDPIADYGRLGFNTDGYNPCGIPPVPTLEGSWGQVKALYR